MRILLTNTGSYGTGSYTASKALMDEFLKLGHEVCLTLCEANPTKELEDQFSILKFPLSNGVDHLNNFPLIISDPNPRNKNGKTLQDLNKGEEDLYFNTLKQFLLETIVNFKPDVVECQHIWAHAIAMNELELPYFAAAHNSEQLGFEQNLRMQPKLVDAAKNALRLFSCSTALKERMLKIYGCESEHIDVTYNGYNKKIFYKRDLSRCEVLTELNLDIPENAYLIVFGGKVSKTKGIDVLIEANELIPKDKNIHFIIIGSGDPEKILDKPISNYQMDNIHFLGHQPPEVLAKLFNIADLGTLPSRFEGFSIAALEALSCGLPLVTTLPAMPEGYEVGKIVPIDDPKSLALAYLEMQATPKAEAKAIEVASHFSWTNIAEHRLKVYEELLPLY